MTAVEQAIAEIDATLAELEPELEGFRDFARLNVDPPTLAQVKDLIGQYDRRVQLLHTGKDALVALMADGHPTISVRVIVESIYTDMAANAATIEAALSKVTPQAEATSLGLSAGPPVLK